MATSSTDLRRARALGQASPPQPSGRAAAGEEVLRTSFSPSLVVRPGGTSSPSTSPIPESSRTRSSHAPVGVSSVPVHTKRTAPPAFELPAIDPRPVSFSNRRALGAAPSSSSGQRPLRRPSNGHGSSSQRQVGPATLGQAVLHGVRLARLPVGCDRLRVESRGRSPATRSKEPPENASTTSIPLEILARGERAQRKFKEALTKGVQRLRTLKVMFVGRGRAGKTSTLKSLCNEAFDAAEASTHGLAHGICAASAGLIEVTPAGKSSVKSSEWKRLEPAHDALDFIDTVLDTAVARHVAAQLKRPSTRGLSLEQELERERATYELPPLEAAPGLPGGVKPRRRCSGGGAGTASEGIHDIATKAEKEVMHKMPVDLLVKHMKDDGKEDMITLQTFDFAGQKEYRMLHHLFVANKGLYVVVFNLGLWLPQNRAGGRHNEAEGDEEAEALSFWLSTIHCCAPESRVLLAGTHLDQLGALRDEVFREVDGQIQQMLDRNSMLNEQLVVNTVEELCFFPVDNRRKARHGVEPLRAKLLEAATEICTSGFLSKELPIYWLKFQTELLRLGRLGPQRYWASQALEADQCDEDAASPVHVLPHSEVAKLAQSVNITDEAELQSLLIFLHDTGSVVFFDEPALHDVVVLDPHWLAEAAANIFNCPRVVQGNVAHARRLLEQGELHIDLLRNHLWKAPRFAAHMDTLLKLLVRLDLLVASTEDPRVYVVPALLPMKSGTYVPVDNGSLTFDFHGMLRRLLPSVFPRLIANAAKSESIRLTYSRVYRDSATVFLGREKLSFELVPPEQPEMIAVRPLGGADEEDEEDATNSGQGLSLGLARQVIDLVHSSTAEWMPHLSFTAGVLCPHCQQSGTPHVIDVAELGDELVVCRRTHEPVSLKGVTWAYQWRRETQQGPTDMLRLPSQAPSRQTSPSEAADKAEEEAPGQSARLRQRAQTDTTVEQLQLQLPRVPTVDKLPIINVGPPDSDGDETKSWQPTSPEAEGKPFLAAPVQIEAGDDPSMPRRPLSAGAQPAEPVMGPTLSEGLRSEGLGRSRRLGRIERRPPLPQVDVSSPKMRRTSSSSLVAPASPSVSSPSPLFRAVRQPGLLYFVYASPLNHEQLDVKSELQLLQAAMQSDRRTALDRRRFHVEVDVRLGTPQNLLELLTHGDAAHQDRPVFLHCVMHAGVGHSDPETTTTAKTDSYAQSFLVLEDDVGRAQVLPRWRLMSWLSQASSCDRECPVSGVFLNSCDSEGIGRAFMEAGVPHVVCCRGQVFDSACKTFTRTFYRALAASRPVLAAFEVAREAVRCSTQPGLRTEADKFMLLPRREDILCSPRLSVTSVSRHCTATLADLTSPFPIAGLEPPLAPAGNAGLALQLMAAVGGPCGGRQFLPARTQHYLGRTAEMCELLQHLARDRGVRIVNVWGTEGLGKTGLLVEATRFSICPGRLFSGAAVWVPLRLDPLGADSSPDQSPQEDRVPRRPLIHRSLSSGHEGGRGMSFLEQVANAVTAFEECFVSAGGGGGGGSPSTSTDVGSELAFSAVGSLKTDGESDFKQALIAASPGGPLKEALLRSLRRLEYDGNRVLLVLDGIEDWIDSPEVCTVIADMLQSTERLRLLLGSRIHVQASFGGLKTDNLELKPLRPRDAAQLFLYRVHRHIFWKDLWRTKEEWLEHAVKWLGGSTLSQVADRTKLEQGEVPITLERAHRSEVLDTLAAMPLLSEFCGGVPQKIVSTAERVTRKLDSLWDLLEEMRDEQEVRRREIRERLLSAAGRRTSAKKTQKGLKEWQLGKVIGQGAHGVVYHAFDHSTGETFAVKVTEDIPGLRQELEMYQLLSHDHIVSYLGHEVHDTQMYIFLEYMPGGNLRQKLAEFGAFQEDLCCALAHQVLQALAYLHGEQVLHRDLKCSNLLLDVSGQVKIADFGCARWIKEDHQAKSFIGSPLWLAPEVIRGDAYAQPADIWSFGCTVVELLTAKSPWADQVSADHPFVAANQIQQHTKLGERPGPGPDDERLSAMCRDFVWQSCLQVPPSRRATAESLLVHEWLTLRPT